MSENNAGVICLKCGNIDHGEKHECRPIKVFQLNGCDWWAGRDLDEVKADYTKETGIPEEDEPFDNPHEITEQGMVRLKFKKDLGDPDSPEWTFREQLDRMIAQGEKFPCFFASTEY